MAAPWDRRSVEEVSRRQDALVREHVAEGTARFSPFWQQQLRAAGISPSRLTRVAALAEVPAVGERDVCPDGDPAGAARLVVRLDEAGYARSAAGPDYRRALGRRLLRPAAYRRQVEAAVRPVSYHLGGLALALPVASTRGDLDLMARAGARAWAVLGLTRSDVLVSALPPGPELAPVALSYAALGAGAPAVHAGPRRAREALATVGASVVAVDSAERLAELLPLPASVRTVLLVGPRLGSDAAAAAESVPGRKVLGVWGPPDGRVLYAQCPGGGATAGLHTYPDLEVLQTVDPATGEPAQGAGELVVTQLGWRGSALLRWRTGAVLASPVAARPCPGCGRTVPRLPADLVPGALVPRLAQRGRPAQPVDLRAVAGSLAARSDLAGWVVDARVSARDATAQLVVRIAARPGSDRVQVAAQAHAAVLAAAGARPTQVVLDPGVAGRPGQVLLAAELLAGG